MKRSILNFSGGFVGLVLGCGLLLGACGGDGGDPEFEDGVDTESAGEEDRETPLTAHLQASRTTCVAPCLIKFDATGTLAGATDEAFHDVSYRWDFGDPNSGSWAAGAAAQGASSWPRNEDSGPLAAHVFDPERSGETYDDDCGLGANTCRRYSVTLSAALNEETSVRTVEVEVSSPDAHFAGATVCLSTGTDFSGCPSADTADHYQVGSTGGCDDWDDCVASVLSLSPIRILSRRGDTFSSDATVNIGSPTGENSGISTGLLGAFGSGPNPLIETHGNGLAVSAADWRVDSLDLRGVADPVSAEVPGWGLRLRDDDHLLVYRSSVVDYQNLVVRVGDFPKVTGLVESVIGPTFHPAGTYALLGSGHQLVILGSEIAGVDGGAARTQQIYLYGGNELQLSHNRIGPSPRVHSDLGLGQQDGGSSVHTLISDNYIVHGTGDAGIACCTGVAGGVAESVQWRDVLIERNLATTTGGSDGRALVSLSLGERVTVRNNLFVLDDIAMGVLEILHPNDGDGPQRADKIRVYNNSVFSSDDHYWETWWPAMITVLSSGVTGIELRNNLMWSEAAYNIPLFTECRQIEDCVDVGNWDRLDGELLSSPFVSADPAMPDDFALENGAEPIDQGHSLTQVFDDFFGALRAENADIGAVEFVE